MARPRLMLIATLRLINRVPVVMKLNVAMAALNETVK
jgi:hypothetical protein